MRTRLEGGCHAAQSGAGTGSGVTRNTSDLDVYLAHRAALIDYAAPIVGGRAAAEDIVQDAFIRLRDRRMRHPVAYLYRMVRNLALDTVRSSGKPAGSLPDVGEMPAPLPTPEQAAQDREQLQVLAEALAELPERTRTAFVMHRLEGRSLQEVADHLGISVVRAHQLVKTALRHGMRRLDELA